MAIKYFFFFQFSFIYGNRTHFGKRTEGRRKVYTRMNKVVKTTLSLIFQMFLSEMLNEPCHADYCWDTVVRVGLPLFSFHFCFFVSPFLGTRNNMENHGIVLLHRK